MSDDKNKRDARDRNQVAGDEDFELDYMVEKLNVTREQVREAIREVGNNRDKVEAYLKKGA
jgi:NACalpha-BTF3-like transcription factor